MHTTHTAELLQRLKKGALDPSDIASLEQVSADHLLNELRGSRYTLTFQERRIGKKWEVSIAHSVHAELVFRRIPDAVFVSLLLVPTYLDCIMLNIENDRLTGISRITRLTIRPVGKPQRGLALKSGRGFKLDKTPDGWEIKPMKRRVVKLSGQFLQARGWQFDHLKQFLPSP
jgi:hypothetical protein